VGIGLDDTVGDGPGNTVGVVPGDGLGDRVGVVAGAGDGLGDPAGDVAGVGDRVGDEVRVGVAVAVGVASLLGVLVPCPPPDVLVGVATTLRPGEGCGSGVDDGEVEQAAREAPAINVTTPRPAMVSLLSSHARAVVACTFIRASRCV
jgi:hypothetical protein